MSDAVTERINLAYLQTRPVMGSSDDTDAGHTAALNAARLELARAALEDYSAGTSTLAALLVDLKKALCC